MIPKSGNWPRAGALAVGGGVAAGAALAVVLWASAGSQPLAPVPSITHDYPGNHLHGIGYGAETDSLYLATHFGLFVLRDGELFHVGALRDDLMGFAAHPDDPDTFYASGHPRGGGNLGVIVSRDGGQNWERIFAGLDDETVDFHSMVASPAEPERLFGVYAGALYVGDTGSGAWRRAAAEGLAPEGFCWGVPCLAASPRDRNRLYAGTPDGLYVSADAGESWRPLSGVSGAVAGVGVHPREPGMMIAHTDAYGIAVSRDGGASWASRDAGFALGGGDFVFAFAFDPGDADRVFAASIHGQVFGTADGGMSWRRILGPDGTVE